MKKTKETSRRTFLRNIATTGAGFLIVPRHVLGRGFTLPATH